MEFWKCMCLLLNSSTNLTCVQPFSTSVKNISVVIEVEVCLPICEPQITLVDPILLPSFHSFNPDIKRLNLTIGLILNLIMFRPMKLESSVVVLHRSTVKSVPHAPTQIVYATHLHSCIDLRLFKVWLLIASFWVLYID